MFLAFLNGPTGRGDAPMRTFRTNLPALACVVLGVTTFLLLASPAAAAQFDPRREWVSQDQSIVLRKTGPGQWTEFREGAPPRRYDELRCTPEFVEIYTG